MTTAQILESYDIVKGIVTNPGKFEGEPAYVPYFWELGLDGMADEDFTDVGGAVYAFDITEDDKIFFPGLLKYKRIELRESEVGFVSAKLS